MEFLILHFLKGYVRIQIRGTSYDRFLNLCAFHGLKLWDLTPAGDTYEANLSVRDFKKLRSIIKKSHVSICIKERHGLPFFIFRYRKRKFYLVGIAAALLFMFWLSAHIWNIKIEGNTSLTDDIIFEYLDQSGITHGIPKAQVDCKELAAEIRNYFSQFSWVSVELKGTRLIICVKEGILQEINPADNGTSEDVNGNSAADTCTSSSLTASKAGTIVSIYVRKGIPMVAAGDEVEPGSLLVSGAVPIYDDSQSVVSWQYVNCDADIVIETKMQYDDTVPYEVVEKSYTGKEKTCFQFRLGNTVFGFPNQFDDFEQYDLLVESRQIQLLENFYLPIYISKFTAKEYNNQQIRRTKEENADILRGNLEYFMKNLEEKGLQIFENDVKIEWNEKSAIATGTLTLGEYAVNRVAVGDTEEELLKNEYG